MDMETVDADRYVSYADAFFADAMTAGRFWVRVRDLGESFYDRWLDCPDDWGLYAIAEACMYELRLSTTARGCERDPFVPSPADAAGRPSPVELSEVPQQSVDLWRACASSDRLNPLLKARLMDLLWVRADGNLKERSQAAIDAYLRIAELEQVDDEERLSVLLRALELSYRAGNDELHDWIASRIDSFLHEYPEVALSSGFEFFESHVSLLLHHR
ncbi:DUF7380 domain-containing protein [Candidatus Poriferisodalis sp.]|uniref:DUF7380 domain-containing protein n=1 Tax=Candidatus Poriferisodalis sp. TaxID=3101277 RepID=UPI003B0121F2